MLAKLDLIILKNAPYAKNAMLSRDGKSITAALAAITFVDADGSVKPAYPAAFNAYNTAIGAVAGFTTGLEVGAWLHFLKNAY